MPRPLRSSCDRCHSQKLKCPKQPGLATCTRCSKAGTTCVFSPAGLTARRAMLTPACLNDELNTQLDWSSLDWESALGATELAPDFQLDEARSIGQIEAAKQTPRASSVHQLTTLAAEVDQLYIDMSSMVLVHVPRNSSLEAAHSSFIDHFTAHRCVEQLFTLSQRLADIYPRTIKVLFSSPGTSECKDPECFHTLELPSDLEELFAGMEEERNSVDAFLFNLLVVCHTKVLDVMGLLMTSARTCTQITLGSPDLREPEVHIPEVRVGNFVATNSAASSMQTALLVHIASILLDYARQLSKEVATVADRNESSRQSRLLKLQCELLEEKALSKVNLLGNVRGVLVKLGCMK